MVKFVIIFVMVAMLSGCQWNKDKNQNEIKEQSIAIDGKSGLDKNQKKKAVKFLLKNLGKK
jgi:uncharacterized lipoprotein